MKKQLTYLWKGAIIGLGIFPGASGGAFATILGLHATLLNIGKSLFSHPFKILREYWGLLLGVFLGVLFSFYAANILIKYAPVPTAFLIAGFIIGSIPKFYNLNKGKEITWLDYLLMILAIGVIVSLPFISPGASVEAEALKAIIILFIVGFILGAVIVLPGFSGSLVLTVLGFYFFLSQTITEVIASLVSLDFTAFFTGILYFIPVILGFAVGMFSLSKLISRLLEKYQNRVYWVILGFLIASPFSIIFAIIRAYYERANDNLILTIILSFVTLIIGLSLAYLVARYELKHNLVVDKDDELLLEQQKNIDKDITE